MSDRNENSGCEPLTLRSVLSEIARLPPWIERLAALHSIPERTRFAMDLCLEEAVSNVIRHGYSGDPDHALTVRCEPVQNGFLTLVVEDDAPPFNPLLVQQQPEPASLGELAVGGQGIHLLKQFADAVEYERKPDGNRLRIRFACSAASQGLPATPHS